MARVLMLGIDLRLFETILNVVRRGAPSAAIALIERPEAASEGVDRALAASKA